MDIKYQLVGANHVNALIHAMVYIVVNQMNNAGEKILTVTYLKYIRKYKL